MYLFFPSPQMLTCLQQDKNTYWSFNSSYWYVLALHTPAGNRRKTFHFICSTLAQNQWPFLSDCILHPPSKGSTDSCMHHFLIIAFEKRMKFMLPQSLIFEKTVGRESLHGHVSSSDIITLQVLEVYLHLMYLWKCQWQRKQVGILA